MKSLFRSITPYLAALILCATLGFPSAGVSAPIHYSRRALPPKKKPPAPPTYSYQKAPHTPQEIWDQVKPFFLPDNHPLKPKLDAIFSGSRVLLSLDGFKKAGFSQYKMRPWSRAIVAKHPKLPGVVIKAYLDTELVHADWERWLSRVAGAHSIRLAIGRHGYEKLFKVPLKWIYPLPAQPSPPLSAEYSRKDFILIAEEMDLISKNDNLNAWRMQITPEILDAIYTLIKEEGLYDSLIASNIPFTKDGRQTFLDTEHHHHWPIHYEKLGTYLSPPMQLYWNMVINNHGPIHKRASKN